MEIRKLIRSDEDFYAVLGPVFGSRLIEKQTKDRFYDDADKVWYVVQGKGAASVLSDMRVVLGKDDAKHQADAEAVPESLRLNLVEADVRNVG